MDETFSSIDLVTQCLLDTERTTLFEKVIKEVVKSGSIVLDAGTGSGILSLFAAQAGASKVYSVEFNPYVAELAKRSVINNCFEHIIDVYLGDICDVDFNQNIVFDVVIMEMLTTGMVDEHQIRAINSLFQRGYVNEKTIFIPFNQKTFVCLAQTDFSNHSFNLRIVKHFWKFLPKCKIDFLSETQLLNSVSFNKINNINFKSKIVFDIKENGILNSIYLSSQTWLKKGIKLEDTLALNAPVVFPLKEDIQVKKGDRLELDVDYNFGNGYRNFKVNAVKL